MAGEKVLLALFALCPVLVQSCSCPVWPVDRVETLKQALEYSSQIYSGVVLGATCSCFSGNGTMDCRRYSYSEEYDTYTVDTVKRVVGIDTGNSDPNYHFKTCIEAESCCLAVGKKNQTGPELVENIISDTIYPRQICPFNDPSFNHDVCMYSVKVTEVFVGTYTVDEVITSSGPYVGFCGQLGRILQLNEEYVSGVGSFCSDAFNEWSPLSEFTEEDLNFLRGTTISQSATINSSAAAVIILLTLAGIAVM